VHTPFKRANNTRLIVHIFLLVKFHTAYFFVEAEVYQLLFCCTIVLFNDNALRIYIEILKFNKTEKLLRFLYIKQAVNELPWTTRAFE
jgi:hypothetical protein